MSEPIPERLRAALADQYELHEELGAGGMATVYLADDLKHERKVAVKVLRPELAAVIGGERFITEIKTTAALQHPHILPLFDSGEADSFLYYVMPFVEGESLRAKLDRDRQLELDEAVHIARAVASALQYAHERDIIHRDIKPENILLHAGEPVVADFGIALAISAAGGGRMTETGLSLGTPHYMSPEQAAADRDLSARSDVYSIACVLYEMLAGTPPHTGPTAQSILVRILTESPRPVSEQRPAVPKHLRAVVAKGLEKLPADRFKSAEEFKAALDDEGFTYTPVAVTGAQPGATIGATAATPAPMVAAPSGVNKLLAGAAAFFAITTVFFALAGGGARSVSAPDTLPYVSFSAVDDASSVNWIEVGPDGTVAYIEDQSIFVRHPGALEAARIGGVTDALQFDISPDGEWIVFATGTGTGGMLAKVPITGGPVATLWSIQGAAPFFPSWADDGFIYFSAGQGPVGLRRVPDVGGEPEILLDGSGTFFMHPTLLPGGGAITFTQASTGGLNGRVMLLDLESRDTTEIISEGFGARWTETGHLVFGHPSGSLWAVPFDVDAGVATGAAVPVAEGIQTGGSFVFFSLNELGTLAFMSGAVTGAGATAGELFSLVDEEGNKELLPTEPSDHPDARLSPDGRTLAYVNGNDVYMFDLDRGSNVRLTEGGSGQHNPIWSPDGRRIAYRSGDDMLVRAVDLSSDPVPITSTASPDNPVEWLEDGTLIIATEIDRDGDLMMMRPDDDTPVEPLLTANWQERGGAVSPDGRWFAYQSAREGERRVYVRTWPELEDEVLVSLPQGFLPLQSYPAWSLDSRTLYYHMTNYVIAARLDTSDGISVAATDTLPFTVPFPGRVMDVHPVDGRILITGPANVPEQTGSEDDVVPQLIVSTNWFTELRARLGEGNN